MCCVYEASCEKWRMQGVKNRLCLELFGFFFKQKTAYEMRIGVWSSDVCSSDLRPLITNKLPVTFSQRQFGQALTYRLFIAGMQVIRIAHVHGNDHAGIFHL